MKKIINLIEGHITSITSSDVCDHFIQFVAYASTERSLFYILFVFSHEISCLLISSNNICTVHSIAFSSCLSYSKSSTFFPYNLGKVSCATGTLSRAEAIAWFTNFSIPDEGIVNKYIEKFSSCKYLF